MLTYSTYYPICLIIVTWLVVTESRILFLWYSQLTNFFLKRLHLESMDKGSSGMDGKILAISIFWPPFSRKVIFSCIMNMDNRLQAYFILLHFALLHFIDAVLFPNWRFVATMYQASLSASLFQHHLLTLYPLCDILIILKVF